MLGNFQQSNLRIEIKATQKAIRESLLYPSKLRSWLWPQFISLSLPETLYAGSTFTSWTGVVPITHSVEIAEDNYLRMLLSQGVDGYHEWSWGEGWIQSRIEGISALPLNLGQTLSLLRLKKFLGD
jgi:hypothetical protein